MEDDEDDFYGTGSGVKQEQAEDGDDKEEKMDVSEGEEEEDSDDVCKTIEAHVPEAVDTDRNTTRMSNSPSKSLRAQSQSRRRSNL